MNMMTGAVAINGGVGVMEVRQPIAKNVAQAAEQMAADLAVNTHITLRELKTKIDTVVEKKLPTFKTLMEKEPVAVAQTMVNGAKLTAYENGYAVYEVDGSHTVMAVDRCNDYRYDFTDGTYEVIPAEAFEDVEWSVRLLMEGERRMEHFWQMSPRFKGGHHAGSTCNPFCFQLEEVAELYAICKAGAELSK